MSVIDSQHVGKAFLLEFPIPGRDSARPAQECVGHIQRLFTVQVSVPGTQTSRGEWVSVQGRQENITKAKRYILALCTPEVRVEASRQPHLARLLFNGGSSVRFELERDYQTVLSSDPSGAVHVQGAEGDVYATVDKLISLEALHHGNAHHNPSQLPVTTVAASTSVQPTYSGREMDRSHHYHPRQPQYDSYPHQSLHGQVLSRGTDPRREKRIDYFVSLGYTREKVEGVLCALPDAADDVILNRLVQCTPRSRPPPDLADVSVMDPLPVNPESLRHIVIDGSNVAMRHGNGVFSCKGIQLAVDYFKKRGHTNITVFVPEWRKEASAPDTRITDQHILFSLEQKGHLKYTPSRKLAEGRRIVCYDDRFIVKLATDEQGVIVSNDQFRDLVNEKAEWKETIETRLLQFTFVNDYFMPPDDPLGRNGPSLDQLLSKDPNAGLLSRVPRRSPAQSNLQICPHLERCTFGKKCKYWHPERDPSSSSGSNSSHTPSTSRSPTPSPSPDKRYMLQSTRSREDLRPPESGYSTPAADIPLSDLNDRMLSMSVHSKPEPPQYINLQQPRLQEYPQQVMRSTPTLPGPDPSMLAPPEPGHQERKQYTFPLMNLSHGPPSYVERPKGVTEDFSHQLVHRHHALTPSHRAHTREHEPRYEVQHIGLPGPSHPNLLHRDPTPIQRDGPTHYMRYPDQGDHYQRRLSPLHFPSHHHMHSNSYPTLPPPHSTPPPRSRTQSDYGSQRYDPVMFEKAAAVLPNCEDRLRRVFAQWPGISWQEAVDRARSME